MSYELAIKKSFGKHKYTLIFLHGFNGSGEEWIRVLKPQIPHHVKFICPKATRISIAFKDGQLFRSWFDILSLNSTEICEDKRTLENASNSIRKLIDSEIEGGIKPEDIIIGGIDEGGALAIYLTFLLANDDIFLGGLIALSTWIPQIENFPYNNSKNLDLKIPYKIPAPVLHCHGEGNEFISFQIGKSTNKILKKYFENIKFKIYDRMGLNDFTAKVVFDMGSWIRDIFI